MEVGKRYYLIMHAYYHFVGEVEEVLGPKTVRLRNVCQVHSCRRNWTEFFAKGFAKDTQYDVWPDGFTVTALSFVEWPHDIPTKRSQ